MNQRTHISYFDPMRVLACAAVIFMHTASGPLRQPIDGSWYWTNALTCLSFTAVPLFLMMSGALLLTDERTADLSVLLRHRLPRLLLPFLFWNLAATVWVLHLEDNLTVLGFLTKTVSSLHQPVMVHFWYLYTLTGLYVLSPLLYVLMQNLGKAGHRLLFTLIVLLSVQAMAEALVPAPYNRIFEVEMLHQLRFLGGHLATFLLGYYLMKSGQRVPNWILGLIAALTFSIITVGTALLTRRTGVFDQTFQSQSAGFEVLLAACIFLLFKQNYRGGPRLEALWRPVVRLSLPIYLSHNLVLSVAFAFGWQVHGLGSILLTTAAVLALCLLGCAMAAWLPPLRYLITGLRK